jgi:putative membrane protein
LQEASPRELAFPRLPVTRRPDPALLRYYEVTSLAAGPFFFVVLLPLYFKYHSLRYVVEEEGITMRWGVLFRKEISLTYARIQDIHLTSNFVERWLGLARIQVQTASGSSSAEMTIEGLREFEAVRDFLYARMRGARDHGPGAPTGRVPAAADPSMQALADTLREVAAEVRALRAAVTERESGGPNA